MAFFVSDIMNGTGALNAIAGEVGATWTKHPSYSGTISKGSGKAYCSSSGAKGLYYASGLPATSEYEVITTISFNAQSDNDELGPCARVDPASDTMYRALWQAFGEFSFVQLIKMVSGTATSLGSASQAAGAAASTADLKLEVYNATKKIFWNGVQLVSSADNSITAAGRVGIHATTSSATTSTVTVEQAWGNDLVSVASTPPRPLSVIDRPAPMRASTR